MKKLILPIALLVFISIAFTSNVSASSDCRQEYKDWRSVCEQSVTPCNECQGTDKNPACEKACNDAVDKCIQAGDTLDACLGVDRKTWVLQPQTPGHLTCDEWKKLSILGAAQNCPDLSWQPETGGAWCSASIEEGVSRTGKVPPDYIFDFNYNSCTSSASADDVRLFNKGSPLTSNSSSKVSQKPNPISKFVRDIQNYFKPSGTNAGKDVKPDFSVDKPPFKDPKTQAEQAKMSSPAQAINSWIEEVFGEDAPIVKISDPETLNRVPKLTDQAVSQAKEKSNPQKSPFQIPVLNGEAAVKLPGSNEWAPIKEGDKIVPGSTIFTGMDTTTVLMIEDKGAVQISSFTEITVSDQGLEQASKEGKTYIDLKLHTGEVEVNVEGGVLPATLQIQTLNVTAGVRGTHFWVNYNSSKGVSIVGVYRGTVDVKDNLGSEKAISPQNDKTEAVLVSKQFSTTKLILYGLLVVAVVGLLIFFKRKRRGMNSLAPRKRISK